MNDECKIGKSIGKCRDVQNGLCPFWATAGTRIIRSIGTGFLTAFFIAKRCILVSCKTSVKYGLTSGNDSVGGFASARFGNSPADWSSIIRHLDEKTEL